jgi:hypothetical protein
MAYTTINKSTDYFNTKLYTGNGSNNHTITGVGFDTDLAWIKNRGGDDHRLFDKVRGVNKFVKSNTTDAETTDAIFTTNSDGYVVTNAGEVNANNQNFVGWNWKANGAGSANTDGSISSTVSVNTTAGFSIVSFNQASSPQTIGHGLNSVPKIIFIKDRDSVANWQVYSESIGASNKLLLDSSNASASSGVFNSTAPTSSVFTFNSNFGSTDYIAYCFAEKTGYSKFGSYTGNGNANGPFIFTGFKPKWLLIRRTDTGDGWMMYDDKRIGYNPNNYLLEAHTNTAEYSSDRMDLLSNGFKPRYNWSAINASGGTYIYMAFGQSLVGSNNIPATAR